MEKGTDGSGKPSGAIDKKFNPEFRIRIEPDGWATIWDDTGFIELAPEEVDLLRNFLAEGPGAKRPEQTPPGNLGVTAGEERKIG